MTPEATDWIARFQAEIALLDEDGLISALNSLRLIRQTVDPRLYAAMRKNMVLKLAVKVLGINPLDTAARPD